MLDVYEKLIQEILVKGHGSVDAWLDEKTTNILRKQLIQHYKNDHLHLAGIGKMDELHLEDSIRKDQIYWLNKTTNCPAEQCFFGAMNGFIHHLNMTCFAGIRSVEFHYALYEKGAYYKKHIDQFRNDKSRQFSVVFYLNENWIPENGGELVLYLKDEKKEITPNFGKLVCFRSDIPHEVKTSQTQRMSLTGWLKNSSDIGLF